MTSLGRNAMEGSPCGANIKYIEYIEFIFVNIPLVFKAKPGFNYIEYIEYIEYIKYIKYIEYIKYIKYNNCWGSTLRL